MPGRRIAIAIDGPASSGKGTVARAVAAALGYLHLDTGALYRTVGLLVQRAGASPADAEAATAIAEGAELSVAFGAGGARVLANGDDLGDAIRGEAVGAAASAVAVHAGVRAALLEVQQALGRQGGVVMDGRDIGTVVLPDAPLKVWLDASVDERARRRHLDEPGRAFTEVRADLLARDIQDRARAAAPARAAADAVRIDSTGLSVPDIVAAVLALAAERGAH